MSEDSQAGAQSSLPQHDARLIPWADPVAGTLGWKITTQSNGLAVAIAAVTRGTVRSEGGEWQTRIPRAALSVIVLNAGESSLQCRLSTMPDSGTLLLIFAPWPAATVLKCPPPALPAHGQLTACEFLLTTRMGRIVRYLIPVFTTA